MAENIIKTTVSLVDKVYENTGKLLFLKQYLFPEVLFPGSSYTRSLIRPTEVPDSDPWENETRGTSAAENLSTQRMKKLLMTKLILTPTDSSRRLTNMLLFRHSHQTLLS